MEPIELFDQYQRIRELTVDADTWLDSVIGSDLWTDGLNVFVTVEPDDFRQALERFCAGTSLESGSMLDILEELQAFCMSAAQEDEFSFYQALSVGMTWLSLQAETNGVFFNLPVQVTNHSAALLLSRSYRAVWAHAYNAGYELVIDLETKRPTIFRPEHGRIYQKGSWHQEGRTIRYPYMHFFHEMAHLCLYGDLYARVMSENESEDATAFVHMEAVITCLEEIVKAELMQVGYELNLIEDSNGIFQVFAEAGEYRMKIHRGEVEGLSHHELAVYLKRGFQMGAGDLALPDNPVKQLLLARLQLPAEQIRRLDLHYGRLLENLHNHAIWARAAVSRNRLVSYREVADILPLTDKYLETLDLSLTQEAPAARLLSYETMEPPSAHVRQQRKQANAWLELLYRIAEMRGFIERQTGDRSGKVQEGLLELARRAAACYGEQLTAGEHEARLDDMREALLSCVADVEEEAINDRLRAVVVDPFAYLLEPR